MAEGGYGDKEPQINADERRFIFIPRFIGFFIKWFFFVTEFNRIIHRKGRKERKAQPQCGTRMTRIQRIFTDLCQSATSVKSVFYRSCSRMKSIGSKVSAFICVHPWLINLKGQLQAPKKDVKCWRGLINQ
jgi:hypothetical protein